MVRLWFRCFRARLRVFAWPARLRFPSRGAVLAGTPLIQETSLRVCLAFVLTFLESAWPSHPSRFRREQLLKTLSGAFSADGRLHLVFLPGNP